jgi:hypothetical protein
LWPEWIQYGTDHFPADLVCQAAMDGTEFSSTLPAIGFFTPI